MNICETMESVEIDSLHFPLFFTSFRPPGGGNIRDYMPQARANPTSGSGGRSSHAALLEIREVVRVIYGTGWGFRCGEMILGGDMAARLVIMGRNELACGRLDVYQN